MRTKFERRNIGRSPAERPPSGDRRRQLSLRRSLGWFDRRSIGDCRLRRGACGNWLSCLLFCRAGPPDNDAAMHRLRRSRSGWRGPLITQLRSSETLPGRLTRNGCPRSLRATDDERSMTMRRVRASARRGGIRALGQDFGLRHGIRVAERHRGRRCPRRHIVSSAWLAVLLGVLRRRRLGRRHDHWRYRGSNRRRFDGSCVLGHDDSSGSFGHGRRSLEAKFKRHCRIHDPCRSRVIGAELHGGVGVRTRAKTNRG